MSRRTNLCMLLVVCKNKGVYKHQRLRLQVTQTTTSRVMCDAPCAVLCDVPCACAVCVCCAWEAHYAACAGEATGSTEVKYINTKHIRNNQILEHFYSIVSIYVRILSVFSNTIRKSVCPRGLVRGTSGSGGLVAGVS